MNKQELAEIKAMAECYMGKYPLTPITTDQLCRGVLVLVTEVERLQGQIDGLTGSIVDFLMGMSKGKYD